MRKVIAALVVGGLLAGCGVLPQAATATPTRDFGGATVVPSPTVQIRNSDELYGSDNPSGGQNNPTAAALPNEGAMPPLPSGTQAANGASRVQLVLEQGAIITGELYSPAGQIERSPGVLLLGRDPAAWQTLPADLLAEGFTVLNVASGSLQGTSDLDVLLTSLSEAGNVDPGRIAIIGADEAADTALLGCVSYAICDVVVLLSPQSQQTLLNVLPNYNPRPLFVAAAQNDITGFNTAAALARSFADGSRFVQLATGRGTTLLSLNSTLSQQIATWLVDTLN